METVSTDPELLPSLPQGSEWLVKSLFNSSDIGIALVELSNLNITSANPTFDRWLGRHRAHNLEAPLTTFCPQFERILTQIVTNKRGVPTSLSFKRDGMAQSLEVEALLLFEKALQKPQQRLTGLVWLVGWLKPLANDQVTGDSPWQGLFNVLDASPNGLLLLNQDWDCQFVNAEFCRLAEVSAVEMKGRGWMHLFERRNEVLADLLQRLTDRRDARIEFSLPIAGGTQRYLELQMRVHLNEEGSIEYVVGGLFDITEREERFNEIHQLATFDPLTGLYNRRALEDHMQRYLEVAIPLNKSLNVILIGIDRFKSINELYGFEMGDELLIEAARRIKRHVRSSDILARFSGDEFALLLPTTMPEDRLVANLHAIQQDLAGMFEINGRDIFVTTSAGYTTYQPQWGDGLNLKAIVNDIFKEADIGLVAARLRGPNQINRFDVQERERLTSSYAIAQKLPKAVQEGEFYAQFQPIIDPKTGELKKVEALVRWNDSELGTVSPELFIPVAESNGLVESISAQVVEAIQRSLPALTEAFGGSQNVCVAINLSGVQLCDIDAIRRFIDVVMATELAPEQLMLEITEQVLVVEDFDVLNHMYFLRERGFKFSLDDFGTGYSSLSYLTRFPIDEIKLDKSFVSSARESTRNLGLLNSVIDLGKALDLRVVAEGVETQEQYTWLKQMQCDLVQGYYISRPQLPEDVVTWSKARDRGNPGSANP